MSPVCQGRFANSDPLCQLSRGFNFVAFNRKRIWSGAGFFKKNVRYLVWTCRDPISLILGTGFCSDSRDPIFSECRDPITIFADSRDPIFNSREQNRVAKTP